MLRRTLSLISSTRPPVTVSAAKSSYICRSVARAERLTSALHDRAPELAAAIPELVSLRRSCPAWPGYRKARDQPRACLPATKIAHRRRETWWVRQSVHYSATVGSGTVRVRSVAVHPAFGAKSVAAGTTGLDSDVPSMRLRVGHRPRRSKETGDQPRACIPAAKIVP